MRARYLEWLTMTFMIQALSLCYATPVFLASVGMFRAAQVEIESLQLHANHSRLNKTA